MSSYTKFLKLPFIKEAMILAIYTWYINMKKKSIADIFAAEMKSVQFSICSSATYICVTLYI